MGLHSVLQLISGKDITGLFDRVAGNTLLNFHKKR